MVPPICITILISPITVANILITVALLITQVMTLRPYLVGFRV